MSVQTRPIAAQSAGSEAPLVAHRGDVIALATVFCVVLGACLFGIWTRPIGLLASIWPANALLLGLFLRWPQTARPAGWATAGLAFVLADLATGSTPGKALLLNFANLVGIGIGYAILASLPAEVLRLRHPASMLWLVAAAVAASIGAGLVGGIADPILFGGRPFDGFMFWWVTEVVNYLALLPVMLAAPSLWRGAEPSPRVADTAEGGSNPAMASGWRGIVRLVPVLAVLLSCSLSLLIGGPGAIAFPVLSLLWCGLVYPVFPVTLLTLGFCLLGLYYISTTYMQDLSAGLDRAMVFSSRLGVTAVAIAPIMLSIVISGREALLRQLARMARYDALTGLLNRARFTELAGEALAAGRRPGALLMMDLDHFKRINDGYGHAAGDEVLREAARRLRRVLRAGDVMGRMGGEEFAALLPACSPESARMIAQRLCDSLAAEPVRIDDDIAIPVTVSIGLALLQPSEARSLDKMLELADQALYAAKTGGRARVMELETN